MRDTAHYLPCPCGSTLRYRAFDATDPDSGQLYCNSCDRDLGSDNCDKRCRHERAWHFAIQYFTGESEPVQIALTKRYRRSLQKAAKHAR